MADAPPPAAPLDGTPPADMLPAVQVRLEVLVRRLDLIEKRVAHREKALTESREAMLPVAAAGQALADELERLEDLDARVGRLERRGFGPKGALALDFARFEPSEARAGDTVVLSVQVEGFQRGDRLEFVLENVLTETSAAPLPVDITEDDPARVAVAWKVPADTGATPERPGALRFTVRGRGCSARAPVLTVRG